MTTSGIAPAIIGLELSASSPPPAAIYVFILYSYIYIQNNKTDLISIVYFHNSVALLRYSH